MKVNELMIGDWVHFHLGDYANPQGVVNFKIRDCFDLARCADYSPIPLTPEILAKNGLDKVPELSMVLNRDTMPMYHSPMLHYVHEIQHALRLCGLNELADGFKV